MNKVRADSLAFSGVEHGFFGREGGVSQGFYTSLNCGSGSRDEPQAVRENRRLVADALGARSLVSLAQIHSPAVYQIDSQWDAASRPPGDGLVTATPGIALGILTADCAPVLLADTEARVIGAAHAGWKGALGGVIEAVLGAMEQLGASRGRIAAAVGPCISRANYEVGAEFRARFLEAGAAKSEDPQGAPVNARFFVPAPKPGHYRFDLASYVAGRLAAAGVAQIEALSTCTYPVESGYFSFRRSTHRGEPDYGRQVSAILLAP